MRITLTSRAVLAISAVLMAVIPSFLLTAPAAVADISTDTCVEHVVDMTDKHVLDTDTINAAVVNLQNSTGADVYVRAFQTTPEGNAASWWREAYKGCPAWLAPDGTTPSPNIVVIEFGLDHTSAIAYGSNWNDKLDKVVDNIRSRELNSGLKSGKYTNAVTDTLFTLDKALKGTDPYAIDIDWSGVGTFFAVVFKVLLIGALIIAVFVGMFKAGKKYLEWDRERRERARLYAKAVDELSVARKKCGEAVLNANPSELEVSFHSAANKLPADERKPYQLRFDNFMTVVMEESGAFSEISDEEASDAIADVRLLTEKFSRMSMAINGAVNDIKDLVDDMETYLHSHTEEAISNGIKNRSRILEGVGESSTCH